MSPDDGEFSFQLQRPPGRGWPFVPLDCGGRTTLQMVPNLLAPRSSVSPQAFERLLNLGLAIEGLRDIRTRGKLCILQDVQVAGSAVPDIEALVRSNLPFLRADGYLGIDFFGQFAEVCFQPDTLLVTLRRKP